MRHHKRERDKIGATRHAGKGATRLHNRSQRVLLRGGRDGSVKLVRLGDIAEVRFGIKTGANEFFYLQDATENMKFEEVKSKIKNLGQYKTLAQIKSAGLRIVQNGDGSYWLIEEEFLKPVIKSPRELAEIVVEPSTLRYKALICNKSKKELRSKSLLEYIEWGERQKTRESILLKDVPSVRGRRYWWEISETKGNTFWIKETNERLGAFIASPAIPCDCRLYFANASIAFQNSVNSTLSALMSEVNSRGGLGEGARSLMVYEVNRQLILNPEFLPNDRFLLKRRPLKNIFEECGIDSESNIPIEQQEPQPLPDRAKLDKIVFDVLDLSEEERKDVYRAVCRLVWNRISRAQSV